MFWQNAKVKNIANFKHVVLIRSQLGIYADMPSNKAEGNVSWDKKRNLSET